jgi:hypothetical protein
MRKLLFALSALAALALLAPNSGIAQGALNQVGIYTTQTPDLGNITDDDTSIQSLTGGQFTAYVVVTNPWSDTGDSEIMNLGGFEFRIEWGALFVTSTLAPTATNFMSPPDFFCGSNIPVVNGQCTVITLTIGAFGTDPVPFLLSPVSDPNAQSIPGAIAITDADDNFVISQAYPASGAFANPVFGYNTTVVPNEDTSWSEMKALFQ